MKVFRYILVTGVLFTFFISCEKFEEYPIEPHIEYNDFAVVRNQEGKDSLGLISISYTDGDGDIGLKASDTLPPYQANFFISIYGLIKDTLHKIPNTNFYYRIPVLTPNSASKAIKGTIEVEIELYKTIPFLDPDTVAFEMYIMDRALHKSNVVMSPQFVLN